MEHEFQDIHDFEGGDKSHGGYDSILRQRLSSTSSDSGIGSPSPQSYSSPCPLDKMMEEERKFADPMTPIPLHWKSIPMGWK